MSVEVIDNSSSKKAVMRKRNNSGTFNVENPKKMKKVSKPAQEDKGIKKSKKVLGSGPNNDNKPKNRNPGVDSIPKPPSKSAKNLKNIKNADRQDGIDSDRERKGPSKKLKRPAERDDEGSPVKKKKFSSDFKKGTSTNQSSNEKPDWNKFKEEKKALRMKRRAAQKAADSFEVSLEAKKIMESIRSKKCPASEQISQLEKVYSILKGKLLAVAYAHDMSRVLETMLKLAHSHKQTDIIKNMIQELLPEVPAMSKRKYATHVVRAMIAHALPAERLSIARAFRGHVVKLLGHKIGNVALEQLHSKLKPEEQCELNKELYGGSQKLISGKTITGLEVIFDSVPHMKESTLTNTKQILLGLFEKNAVQSHIVHSVLLDFLSYAKPEDQTELLENAQNHIKALTQSKEGVHVAMMCVWLGGAKTRKKIVKDLKDGFINLACGEHTHMLLLAIFDSLDDTVLVQKAVLTELLAGDLTPLLNSKYGRKVLMYLCSRRDPRMFSAPVVATLAQGDNNQYSKKDANIRAEELRKFAVPFLLENIAQNISVWMDNNANILIMLTAVKAGFGSKLQPALKAIANHTANPPTPKNLGIDLRIADNTGCHMVLKKLAQHDKFLAEAGEGTFGEALLSQLTDQHYLAWLKNNHCCFLLLEIMKNSVSEVVETLRSKIKNLSVGAWKNKKDMPTGGQRIKELL